MKGRDKTDVRSTSGFLLFIIPSLFFLHLSSSLFFMLLLLYLCFSLSIEFKATGSKEPAMAILFVYSMCLK